MARIKPKPSKLQQIIEFPLVILGGIIEGCQFIARHLHRLGGASDSKSNSQSTYVRCEQYLASKQLADLEPDERQEVWRGFTPMREQVYLSNHADNILGASAAATICNLAIGMMREVMELESDQEFQADIKAGGKESREMLHELYASRERSLWLARKATDLYPHPVLFERLVKLLEAAGRNEAADRAREFHAKQKATWTSKYTDDLLLMSLNPE